MRSRSFAEAHRRTSATNRRSEMMLNAIGSDTAMLKHQSSNIQVRLSKIERLLPNTIHISSIDDDIISQIEQQTTAVASDKALACRSGSMSTIMCANSVFETSVMTMHSDRIESDDRDTSFQGADWECPASQVGTLLERSPNFSPALCTACGSAPPLIITSFWQTQHSRTSRTNYYHVLFSKSPNVYHQLTVSIDFHVASKFWAVSKVSKDPYQCQESTFLVTLISLPQTLQDQVWQVLAARETLTEQTHVNLAVSRHSANDHQPSQRSLLLRKPIFRPRSSTLFLDDLSIITSLGDLGCALYQEREVKLLASFEPPNRFLSIVAGVLVEEVKCTRSPPSLTFLYAIQAFHCLSGVPGVLSLKGVVIDSSRKHIRSYLLGLPKTKCELLLDYLSGKNNELWEDQEIWARRLIEAVRQVHSKGYTIGNLQRRRLPIIVDTFGALYLSRLEQLAVFRGASHMNAVSPPEIQRDAYLLGSLTPEANTPRITPKFDIYQLGSCLWVLAQSWAEHLTATQAYLDTLYRSTGGPQEHLTSKLPPLSEKVPAYYRQMVEACRRDDPSTRPSANQLLAMLPELKHDNTQTSQLSDHPPLDVPTYLQCRISNPGCSICQCVIPENYYHCNTCDAGDYGICKQCFDAGEHCLEDDHLLIELENSWKCPTAKKYISCVRSTGLREVIEI
ncbi:hypothetical protein IQ06DRAFT_36722 [Phaeosphaeriaceae sp. SRC1lsM3a]|nr:hypothetical protein IQ06DRAFT_36722 [Stagonospora sp. SRC1lsM3a]